MTHDEAQKKAAQLIESGKVENAVVEREERGDNYRVVTKRGMGPRVKDSWEEEDRR